MTREEKIAAAMKAAEAQWDAKYGSWSLAELQAKPSSGWYASGKQSRPGKLNAKRAFQNELAQIRLTAKPRLN